jgi:hypothetical protein
MNTIMVLVVKRHLMQIDFLACRLNFFKLEELAKKKTYQQFDIILQLLHEEDRRYLPVM